MNDVKENEPPYHHGDLRAALLAAAEQEICENDVETFSLRRVARRAGVSHNAPAHHFSDVKDLLTALAALGFERLSQVLLEYQANASSDDKDAFVELGMGYIEFATTQPAMFRLMFSSNKPDRSNPELNAAMKASLGTLAVQTQNARHENGPEDPLEIKDLIAAWSVVHGIADLSNSGLLSELIAGAGEPREDVLRGIIMRLDFD